MTNPKLPRNVALNNSLIFGAPLCVAWGFVVYSWLTSGEVTGLYVYGGIALAASIICGVLFAVKTTQQRSLQHDGVLVEAKLLNSGKITSMGQVPCSLAYVVDGETYQKKLDIISEQVPELEAGKGFQLVVDPKNPKRCCEYKFLFSDRETNIVE